MSGQLGPLPHSVTLVRQYEQGPPESAWRTNAPTGLVCLVCNCGTITGWRPAAEVADLLAEHHAR